MGIQLVVLAGGKGTRLGQLGLKKPKSLVEISGRPFIELQFRLFEKWGVDNAIFCLGYESEQIVDWLTSFNSSRIKVSVSTEGKELIGTGGALVNAKDKLDNEFAVVYGDSFLLVDFDSAFKKFMSNSMNSMCISKTTFEDCPYNVNAKDGLITEYSKNTSSIQFSYIDYGLTFLRKSALIGYAEIKPLDLGEIFNKLIVEKQLAAIEVREPFYEVGTSVGIKRLENFLGMIEL